MNVKEISIKGYRNLNETTIKFSPGVNFICGKNAQGKTNLIEALWMLTGARSFRGSKDEKIVNFNETFAKIEGKISFKNRDEEILICFSGGKRKAFVNGVAQPYPTNIIGKFRAVLFSPVQLFLIKGGPEWRRRFLDAAICQLKSTYTALIVRYNQTLKHRNALLKNSFENNKDLNLLETWDEKLIEYGSLIMFNRLNYLKKLKEEASKVHFEISGGQEELAVNYVSSVIKNIDTDISAEDIKKSLKSKLEKTQSTDIRLGFTSCGPHKDDMELFINKRCVKQFGSQGQQRSVVLALKLAEAAILNIYTGDSPVILLDDVLSELDNSRKLYIIKKTKNWQTLITACDENEVKNMDTEALFKVENGNITRENTFIS